MACWHAQDRLWHTSSLPTSKVDTSVDEGGGDQRLRLGGPSTWSVGDPTLTWHPCAFLAKDGEGSSSRVQPRRESIDRLLAWVTRRVYQIVTISGKLSVQGFHEVACLQLVPHVHITQDAYAFSGEHGFDCVQLFPEAQMVHFIEL